jgi:hypothetical protein
MLFFCGYSCKEKGSPPSAGVPGFYLLQLGGEKKMVSSLTFARIFFLHFSLFWHSNKGVSSIQAMVSEDKCDVSRSNSFIFFCQYGCFYQCKRGGRGGVRKLDNLTL